MEKQSPKCCPYCTCTYVSKAKDEGLIEIGALEFGEGEEEGYPVDVWVCDECNRRFAVLDDNESE